MNEIEQAVFESDNKRHKLEDAILIILLFLSLAGVAITDYSASDGYGYWLIMVFVFAFFAILTAWIQSKRTNREFADIVKHQSMHWLTTLLAVGGGFMLQKSGHLSPDAACFVILLLLSLASMLDGLRIGWRFSLVGLYLGTSSVIGAFYTPHMWIDVIIAIFIVIASIFGEYLVKWLWGILSR